MNSPKEALEKVIFVGSFLVECVRGIGELFTFLRRPSPQRLSLVPRRDYKKRPLADRSTQFPSVFAATQFSNHLGKSKFQLQLIH